MSAGRCLRRLPKSSTTAPSLFVAAKPHPILCSANTAPISTSKRQFTRTSRYYFSSQGEAGLPKSTTESESRSHEKSDLALEDELLAIQDAAIAELEAKLGKPLQQAIEEDRLAENLLAGTSYEDASHEEDYTLVEETESPLESLRTLGASLEEVVREARNIFGDYLPLDVLSKEEFALYRRLYGDPLPEIDQERERLLEEALEVDVDSIPKNVLFGPDGEQLSYRLEDAREIENKIKNRGNVQGGLGPDSHLEEVARAVQGDLVDEEIYEYEMEEDDLEAEDARSHPLTKIGRFGTYPRTTFFSRDEFIKPLQEVMKDYSNKQLRELCEKTFGGPGFPDSPLTPRSGRSRQQVPIPLEAGQNAMGQMEANAFMTVVMPPTYASVSAVLTETRKRLGASWLNKVLAKPGGPRVLDAGSGGVGILAWRDVVQAHWDTLHSSDKHPPPAPESKAVVLAGSDALRHRSMKLLENTTFVPRLPDYISTRQKPTLEDDRPAQQRKQFDIIIASHSLFALKEEWERKLHVQNLWSLLKDDGGVLVFVEKGIPRGFETIAAAREMLLERYIQTPPGHEGSISKTDASINAPDGEVYQKTPGMIIAPCTNHTRCPLYRTPGLSRGRKDICSFQQRYVRPPALQNALGAKDRNHDDVDFSYLAVMKGEDLRTRSFSTWDHITDPMSSATAINAKSAAENHHSVVEEIQTGFEDADPTKTDTPGLPPTHILPRIINQPMKRQAHVTIDLCTPTGEIRRWTIPKSFSKQAYRDARKARWGDLWALGAKTDVPRNLKTGVSEKDFQAGGGKMVGKARGRKERLEMQAERILEAEEVAKTEEEAEEEEFRRMIEEDDLLDEADENIDVGEDEAAESPTRKNTKHKQNHAKLNNINIFGKTTMPKQQRSSSSTSPSTVQSTSQSIPSRPTKKHISRDDPDDDPNAYTPIIERRDYLPGRYGEEDVENLREWSEELDSTLLEDESRAQLSKDGRRPTARNTRRFKRDLRRARKEMGAEGR